MIEDIKLYLKTDPFFEVSSVQEINNDDYEYIWGGCLLNKHTDQIDRYINKAKTAVADVKYESCVFGGRDSFAVYIANRFIGYITTDYKFQASMSQGGDYWLTGIITSYNIVKEKKESERLRKEFLEKQNNECFFEFIKHDRD